MMAAVTRFAERWLPYAPMITPAFFCHSSYTCSPQTLVNVKATARAAGIKAPPKAHAPPIREYAAAHISQQTQTDTIYGDPEYTRVPFKVWNEYIQS
jgi:hypothetical protein